MPEKFTITTAGNGVSASREMMITYLNTGTADSPVWSAMGAKVTDSSIEYDWGVESITDILGVSHTKAKTAQMTQSFTGSEIVGGDAVMNALVNLAVVQKDAQKLVNQDCLIVHTYLKDEGGAAFAERYSASSVIPTTLGGEGGASLVSDIEVTYGGKRTTGTATVADGVVTFTPDVEV